MTLNSPLFANKRLKSPMIFAFILVALNVQAQNTKTGDDLFKQLQSLQRRMNIKITGLERIENEPKTVIEGSLEQQLQHLLAPFNHIISRNTKGRIERVVIVNKKQKTEHDRIILPIHTQGNHLTVSVAISGDGRLWQTLNMIIDTGADLVVLPDSMIAQLGLADSTFALHKMQTANGMADAKVGLLQQLKIAGETVENVETAFIADELLGGNRLLGMSVLSRYQVNIDDKNQALTLYKK